VKRRVDLGAFGGRLTYHGIVTYIASRWTNFKRYSSKGSDPFRWRGDDDPLARGALSLCYLLLKNPFSAGPLFRFRFRRMHGIKKLPAIEQTKLRLVFTSQQIEAQIIDVFRRIGQDHEPKLPLFIEADERPVPAGAAIVPD